jgi:hypothetical protein
MEFRSDEKASATILSCAEVHHVLANGCAEGTCVVELQNVHVTQVLDPLDKTLCKRGTADAEMTVKATIHFGDVTGGVEVTAFQKAAFETYGLAAGEKLDEAGIQNKLDRGWMPTFHGTYDCRLKLDNFKKRGDDVASTAEARPPTNTGHAGGRAELKKIRASIALDQKPRPYLVSDGAVVVACLEDFVYDPIYQQVVMNHLGQKVLLGTNVYLQMTLTGVPGKRADTDPFEGFVRITNFCETAVLGEKSRKLRRLKSGDPNPLEVKTIALATQILDFEISNAFQYLVIGTNVEYDDVRQVFSMTAVRSTRLEGDDHETYKHIFSKEGRDVKVDPEEATIYTETLKNPEELMKVLVKNGSVGKPWGEGV